METANKAQQMVSNNIWKGLQNTTKIAGNTSHKLKQLLGDFDLGVFGNILASTVIIYILYKMGWAYLNGYNYNTQMDFIKKSFYYWVTILTIMVAYAALSIRK